MTHFENTKTIGVCGIYTLETTEDRVWIEAVETGEPSLSKEEAKQLSDILRQWADTAPNDDKKEATE